MKKIYIILTHTGTLLSRLIKYYTGDEFSHVSIALDMKLNRMYSFGRLNPYNPFYGGFVHERINRGTFKRFSKTKAKIYSLEIEEEKYKKLEQTIKYMKELRRIYSFNIIGLIAAGFKVRISKEKKFYCAEFVKYVLDEAKVENNLPEVVKPEDLKRMKNLKLEYEGLLKFYNSSKSVEISV